MVRCVLGVSLHCSKLVTKRFFLHLELRGLRIKQHFHPTKPEYFQSQTWEENTLLSLLYMIASFIKYVCILRETHCLPFLAVKSSDRTLLADEHKKKWKSTLTDYTLGPRNEFTQLWNCRETCFCESGIGVWHFHCETCRVEASNLPKKTHRLILLFNSWTSLFQKLSFQWIRWVSLVDQWVKCACTVGDLGSIPGSGRFPGEGNGNPIQYSCLSNSTDRGAW